MSDTEQVPYHHIARQFFNTPLLLQPAAAHSISGVLLSHMAGRRGGGGDDAGTSTEVFRATPSAGGAEVHSPRASRFVGATPLDDQGRPQPYRRTSDGVAIVTMIGELVNRGAWIGASSGLVSYEGFSFQLAAAARDPNTRAIVIDMETPGGQAVGAFEAAAMVRKIRGVKPVIALVNGMAASAGYLIASGASQIVSIESGFAGSIGVLMVHLDYEEYLKNEGIKPTLIFSGAHKVDGNPFQALPDAVRERFQAESKKFYEKFVAAVAEGRSGLTADLIRGTEAQMFMGMDAVATGLVDSVGTFEDVLAELSSGPNGRAMSNNGATMTKVNDGAAAALVAGQVATIASLADLQAAHPALCLEAGVAAALAERGRIQGILGLPAKGHGALVTAAIADGTSTKADLALQMIEAERATRDMQSAAIAGVETVTGKVAAAGTASGGEPALAPASDAEGWKAEYAKSPALQAEFGGVDLYVALKEGEASGRVRRLAARAL